MKNKAWLLSSLAIVLVLIISACSNNNTTENSMHASGNHNMQAIEVHLQVNPTEVLVGENVKFEAKVTYNGENVDDAKEVMFEFWRDGDDQEQHSKVTVESVGNGLYVLEQAFQDAGTYHVISHVTAKDQHSMPSTDFTVK
ncbi:hypothetical protein D3C78_1512360 [compost metagenome]